jgi:hypothetical protein
MNGMPLESLRAGYSKSVEKSKILGTVFEI